MSEASFLRKHQQNLAERIVDLQYARQPEVWKPYGSPGREKSVRDAGYHLTYLAEALEADDAALFSEYLAWVKALFAGLNFPAEVLPTTLECTRQALSEMLPPDEAAPALSLLTAGMQTLGSAPEAPPPFLVEDAPLAALARDYLEALLRADRRAASQMILAAVENGTPLRDIYLHVFQPVQREVGRLWQTNQISVAQEHFCTAATQMVMSQLYPYLFTGERKERRAVVACVGGELHELGARMVADFFEMNGWDSTFLGANTPPESILRMAEERRADLLALSATMTFHVSRVRDLVAALRAASSRTRVLVGGYPFNLSPGLWRKVGADGYAADAAGAVDEAERVMASPAPAVD
ncbi:MAG: cobalamin-dependent protein [Anaerolineales bacterium]